MSIYEINENKLTVVSKENIKLEHNLQKLTEENLDTYFVHISRCVLILQDML